MKIIVKRDGELLTEIDASTESDGFIINVPSKPTEEKLKLADGLTYEDYYLREKHKTSVLNLHIENILQDKENIEQKYEELKASVKEMREYFDGQRHSKAKRVFNRIF